LFADDCLAQFLGGVETLDADVGKPPGAAITVLIANPERGDTGSLEFFTGGRKFIPIRYMGAPQYLSLYLFSSTFSQFFISSWET
jgi:hypothetical protein